MKSAPKAWPPRWLAFYQTKVFGEDAYAVRYYGRVRRIDCVPRRVLFPAEFPNGKTDQLYYQVHLDHLEKLDQPIRSARLRRIVFIPTTRTPPSRCLRDGCSPGASSGWCGAHSQVCATGWAGHSAPSAAKRYTACFGGGLGGWKTFESFLNDPSGNIMDPHGDYFPTTWGVYTTTEPVR